MDEFTRKCGVPADQLFFQYLLLRAETNILNPELNPFVAAFPGFMASKGSQWLNNP